MQSYIVRICRKDKGNFIGVVENPHGGEKKAFTDYDELWRILSAEQKDQGDDRKKKGFSNRRKGV